MGLVAELEREVAAGNPLPDGGPEANGELDGRPDAELVAAALAGDGGAFAVLVRRYTELVATFAYVRTGDRDLAEEIAQETMVRAYEKLWSLRVPRHFSHWLTGIAGNVTMQILERRRRGPSVDLEEVRAELGAEGPPPGEEASRREFWNRLLREIDALDARYKIPFVMKHQEGLSCEEIAERLGLPEGTVRGRLSRAYGVLRRRLAADLS